MKVCVYTLGCKVNQYDSDSIIARLLKKYDVTDKMEKADVYVINTCAVTAEAERKSRQIMQRAKSLNPDAKILVIGCASQNNPKQFWDKGADFVSGTANKIAICDFENLSGFKNSIGCDEGCFPTAEVFEESGVAASFKTRHFIKVQDGCDNFCNYCLVPYLRGKPRSRSLENILNEVAEVSKAAKEIVLTGINLSAYGKDINLDLSSLLDALKPYDIRVRLGSLEVNVVDDRLLQAAKNLRGFCDHFHLSLQSGSDKVLKEMNRHYTSSEYLSAVEKIRSYFPDAAITTDLIVAYPTETEQDFFDSLEFNLFMTYSNSLLAIFS